MAQKFETQRGFATSNPSALARWAGSKMMTRLGSEASLRRRRRRLEAKRKRSGDPLRVEYFHQLNDGYSHLAAQLLRPLLERYDVELRVHLVSEDAGRNLPEPDLLLALSRYDATLVAPHYGLRFPEPSVAPGREALERASRLLAGVSQEALPEKLVEVGEALWTGGQQGAALNGETDQVSGSKELDDCVAMGNARRAALGHYSGAMFYCEGEWYWGADRFYHLEHRLVELGRAREPAAPPLCPRPEIEFGPLKDQGSLTLEIYPSLRSPYTAVIFETALRLAKETGVRALVRPVLPMVMRGVPATFQKGRYIFTDAAREARALAVDFGRIYDPIGDPVRRAYSLYPWAVEQGRGNELLASFLRRAWCEAVNTNNDKGLKQVVEAAGLSWEQAQLHLGEGGWEEVVESNRLAMYDFGSWGVPSFRLLDESGEAVLALWGQDRLWLFAREIQRLLAQRAA